MLVSWLPHRAQQFVAREQIRARSDRIELALRFARPRESGGLSSLHFFAGFPRGREWAEHALGIISNTTAAGSSTIDHYNV